MSDKVHREGIPIRMFSNALLASDLERIATKPSTFSKKAKQALLMEAARRLRSEC